MSMKWLLNQRDYNEQDYLKSNKQFVCYKDSQNQYQHHTTDILYQNIGDIRMIFKQFN